MKLRVAVFTGTRAEYGLLRPLIQRLAASPKCTLQTIVSGSHLSPEFGHTVSDIEEDGVQIDERVEMLLSSSSKVGVAKSAGLGLISFAEALGRLEPDVLVVLGDRYEALAIAQAALLLEIPIAHLHGGEISEGSADDAMRHMITKASALHFVSNVQHRQRVIQLGECPSRVHNVGALVADQIRDEGKHLSAQQLSCIFNFDFSKPYCLLTYHSAGFSSEHPGDTVQNILTAITSKPELGIVASYPNADAGGREIVDRLEEASSQLGGQMLLVESLGIDRYLSAMKLAEFVIGNSSSGIIEAPFVQTPSVNVGARQVGRLCANSVVSCGVSSLEITKGIDTAMNVNWAEISNPYYVGYSPAERIVKELIAAQLSSQKKFFDLPGGSQWSK